MIGSILGLGLGVACLTSVMAGTAADQGRTEALAQVRDQMLAPAAAATPVAELAIAAVARDVSDSLRGPIATAAVASGRSSWGRELDCLTQAIYFEARGESARGQAAVATVIMNRVKSPKFPKTVCGVVYQGANRRNGCQFSFACDGAAERVVERAAWRRARGVAARTLSGAVLRDVGSATHFHTTAVSPDWGGGMLRVAQVGLHVFYRLNPHGPRPAAHDAAQPVFVSAPASAAPELRLAAALAAPVADSAPAPAAAPAAAPVPVAAKPAVKLPDLPPAGLSKAQATVMSSKAADASES